MLELENNRRDQYIAKLVAEICATNQSQLATYLKEEYSYYDAAGVILMEHAGQEATWIQATEAAKVLGVSLPRIHAMIRDGVLTGRKDEGKSWVRIDEVMARKANPPKAGRRWPKKNPAG